MPKPSGRMAVFASGGRRGQSEGEGAEPGGTGGRGAREVAVMRRLWLAAALCLLLGAFPSDAAQAAPPLRNVVADYDAELRGPDGRVDLDGMVTRLKQLGVNTCFWLVWHAPADWEDLKSFLPKAAAFQAGENAALVLREVGSDEHLKGGDLDGWHPIHPCSSVATEPSRTPPRSSAPGDRAGPASPARPTRARRWWRGRPTRSRCLSGRRSPRGSGGRRRRRGSRAAG